jgi:hypothetical protein
MRGPGAFATLAVAACLGACFSDAGRVFVLPENEGGANATGDATADQNVSKEGGSGSSSGDGNASSSSSGDAMSKSDGPSDSGSPPGEDAGPGTVTVAVTDGAGNPDPGVPVVFSNPDGTFLAQVTTDSTGMASHSVPGGGAMVTALFGNTSSGAATTILDVGGGDVIHLVDPTITPPTPPSQGLDVTSVTYAGDGGTAGFYNLNGLPCLQVGYPPNLFPSDFTCTPPSANGAFSILILAEPAAYQPPFAFTFLKNQSFPTDGGSLSYAFDGSWYPVGTVDVRLTHLPATFTRSITVSYAEYANGFPVTTPGYLYPSQVDAGAASVQLSTDPGFPDYTETWADLSDFGAIFGARAETAPTTVSFDYSQALPAILSVGFDDTTSPGDVRVYWTGAGSLASADGIFLDIGTSYYSNWKVLVPPNAASARLPRRSHHDDGGRCLHAERVRGPAANRNGLPPERWHHARAAPGRDLRRDLSLAVPCGRLA